MKTATIYLMLLMASVPALCTADLIGPTAYFGFDDSPFNGLSFSYFHLEDVEDSLINTPGLSATGGFVSNNGNQDSVDADDGVIDGNGSAGRSYVQQAALSQLTFEFSAALLGALPTNVGVVWTDGSSNGSGVPGQFEFEAFDSLGFSIGILSANLGDGFIAGQTGEDRFFGVTFATGVSRIEFRNLSAASLAYIEVDHIQYGLSVVPALGTSWLLFLGLITLARVRHISRRKLLAAV